MACRKMDLPRLQRNVVLVCAVTHLAERPFFEILLFHRNQKYSSPNVWSWTASSCNRHADDCRLLSDWLVLARASAGKKAGVTYKYRSDDELIQTNQLAATFCSQRLLAPRPLGLSQDDASDIVVRFECVPAAGRPQRRSIRILRIPIEAIRNSSIFH